MDRIFYSLINIVLSNKMIMQLAANLFSFEEDSAECGQKHDIVLHEDQVVNNSMDRSSSVQRSNRLSKFSPPDKRPSRFLNL